MQRNNFFLRIEATFLKSPFLRACNEIVAQKGVTTAIATAKATAKATATVTSIATVTVTVTAIATAIAIVKHYNTRKQQ